ncbi:DUF4214 domain-containing protein [Halomonas sp. LS-001]
MATQENLNLAQQLYVAYYGRPADAAGLQFWAEEIEANGIDAAISAFGNSAEYTERFGDMGNEALVNGIYQQAFGRDADAGGLAFYTEKLESGELDLANIALTIVQNATDTDAQDASTLAAKVAAADMYTEAAGEAHSGNAADEYAANFLSTVDVDTDLDAVSISSVIAGIPSGSEEPEEPEEPATPGETIQHTANADMVEGTANDDTFEAPITTINFANGNTLNSGDMLDGGAGNDTLNAQLVDDAFVTGFSGAVRPSTENVENVVVNAIETGTNGFSTFADSTVTLNAADMYDLVNVWSKDSNANLVIQDVTTKTSDGGVRNTDSLTFRMDHTSNANSGNSNQSDMTVYFDENYLLSGSETEFNIELRIVNTLELAQSDDPLDGFSGVVFSVGDQEVNVDIEGSDTYQDVANAINAELNEQGISGVSATVMPERTAVFTDDIEGFSQGQVAGSYSPVQLVSTTEALSTGPIELNSNIENFDGLNTWVQGGELTTDNPITTNVELYKAGRGDNGGDFYVGGKAGGSIEVFNVAVLGADHKPSDIGWLNTGQNEGGMDTVKIFTHEDFVDGETHADLTIRNGFDNDAGLVSTVNADDFLGEFLTIGNVDRVENVANFSATGGGNVAYFADYATTLDHTITTGDGNDMIDVMLSNTAFDSGSETSKTSVDITSTGGDNTVMLSSSDAENVFNPVVNLATVTTGAGKDVITGGGNSLMVESGGNNDIIYAENTGMKTMAVLAAPVESDAFFNSEGGVSLVELLDNREVTVTLQFPGDHGAVDSYNNGIERTVKVNAREGVITDERDLYQAVADLINEDRVFSSLATATVTSEGNLEVNYLVDGETVAGDELVQIETRDADDIESNDFNNNLVNALREKYSDSTIGAGDLASAYSDASAKAAVMLGDEGTNSSTGGVNTVNAGTGNDVIVLSSNDDTTDTVVIDAGTDFVRNTIAHFNDGDNGDVLDFTAFLDNEASASGSTASRDRVATELDLKANGVHIIDFDDLTSNTTNFNNLTEAQVANGIADFGTGDIVGNEAKAIVMVEGGNSGVYNVYEVTSDGDDNQASLVGVMDFGETQDFTLDNFA